MSGIYYSPTMIAQLEAEARQNGYAAGNANYQLPYGPSDPISNNPSWGTNVNPDNINALIQQINKLFTWATNGDQGDFNTQLDMYALFRNIGAEWGSLGAKGQQEVNQTLSATLGTNGPSVLQAIAMDLVKSIVGGTFYQNGDSFPAAQNTLNGMISDLTNLIGQGASFLQPILDAANSLNGQGVLEKWINTLPSDMTMTTFMEEQAFQFQQDFSMNPNSTSATNQQMSGWINDLIGGLPPGLALILLIIVVMLSMNGDQQVQLTGKANETNALTKAVVNPLHALQASWNTNEGNWTPQTAQDFYNQLAGIEGIVGNGSTLPGDMRFQADQSSVNQLYNDFNGPNGITVTDPNLNGGEPVPIGTAYAAAMNGSISMSQFCSDMNQISMNKATPNVVPPGFTQANSDISTAINAASSQSQSVGTAVQALQQVIDKFESLITSILQDNLNLEKTSTTASGSAGS